MQHIGEFNRLPSQLRHKESEVSRLKQELPMTGTNKYAKNWTLIQSNTHSGNNQLRDINTHPFDGSESPGRRFSKTGECEEVMKSICNFNLIS